MESGKKISDHKLAATMREGCGAQDNRSALIGVVRLAQAAKANEIRLAALGAVIVGLRDMLERARSADEMRREIERMLVNAAAEGVKAFLVEAQDCGP